MTLTAKVSRRYERSPVFWASPSQTQPTAKIQWYDEAGTLQFAAVIGAETDEGLEKRIAEIIAEGPQAVLARQKAEADAMLAKSRK